MLKQLIPIFLLLIFFVGTIFIAPQTKASLQEKQLIIPFQKTVIINDNGLEFSLEVPSFFNVEQVLLRTKLNIDFSFDEIYPGLSEKNFSKIIVKRKIPFKISCDGKEIKEKTFKKTVEELLEERGIELGEKDKIFPGIKSQIFSNIEIKIIRVEEKIVKEKREVPFKVEYRYDDSLFREESKILQEGRSGEKEIEYLVVFEDGKEIKKIFKKEKILVSPENKIILKGTRLAPQDWQEGIASWCNKGRCQGFYAASIKFSRGTKLKVINLANNQSVNVIINDYGPEVSTGKIIDLGSQAFKELAPLWEGLIRVRVEKQ